MAEKHPSAVTRATEPDIDEAFPVNRWAAKADGIGVEERRLYASILRAFLTHGRPPDRAVLLATVERIGVELDGALAELVRRDALDVARRKTLNADSHVRARHREVLEVERPSSRCHLCPRRPEGIVSPISLKSRF